METQVPTVEYNNFKYNRPKGRRTKRRLAIFPITLILTALVICFFVANMFFEFVNFMPAKTLTLDKVVLYAVKMDQFNDKHSANVYSAEKRSLGAGGYVYVDSRFHVIASVYKTKADAQKVATQIKPQIPTVSVLDFVTPKKKFQLLKKEHKGLCDSIAKSFVKNYEMLYDLTLQFDAGEIGQDVIKVAVIKAYNTLNDDMDKLVQINQSQSYAPYTRLLGAGQVQMVTLYNLAYGSNFVYGMSSEIKNAYCNILYTFMELAKV